MKPTMKRSQAWAILLIHLSVALACEHSHRYPHPGGTEHAIVHPLDSGNYSSSTQLSRSLSGRLRSSFRCGTPNPSQHTAQKSMKVVERWKSRHHGRDLESENVTIKVYWHVMKIGDTKELGAWTTKRVRRSIAKANHHFRTSPFRFELAGVTQTTKPSWFKCKDDNYDTEYQFKTNLRVEGADVLNVYMCDLLTYQGLWGFAYLPGILKDYPEYDGIVLSNPFPQGYTALDTHMTFVHEAGHWLGLYHTWSGGCVADSGGDAVHDTPAHRENTWTYKGWQTCFEGITYNTCPDNQSGVDPGLDPLLNHMNYVSTPCQNSKGQFTSGQVERMTAMFETYRHNKSTCRFKGVRCLNDSHCCSKTCKNQECVAK